MFLALTRILAAKAPATEAAPTSEAASQPTIEELASEAWQHAKILPGNDGKYNWLEIGMNEGSLEASLLASALALTALTAGGARCFNYNRYPRRFDIP